jgi:hypothetical protein
MIRSISIKVIFDSDFAAGFFIQKHFKPFIKPSGDLCFIKFPACNKLNLETSKKMENLHSGLCILNLMRDNKACVSKIRKITAHPFLLIID